MRTRRYNHVLAVYFNTRGFAYVLFESAFSPIRWGVVEVRGKEKNRRCIRRVSGLFGQYQPDMLVLQDMSELTGTRRARRIRQLNEAIEVLAETQNIPVAAYSRAAVRECFRGFGCFNKHSIAEAIAKHVSAFKRYVPPPRKLWMNETARMALFDAAALILTFYHDGKGL